MNDKDSYEERVSQIKLQITDLYKILSSLYLEINNDELVSDKDKESLLSKIDHFYSSREVTQRLVPYVSKRDLGASYQDSIINLIRFKKNIKKNGLPISPGGNNKGHDRKFAELLGVEVPQQYKFKEAFSEIEYLENTVLKPFSGSSSKNVFFMSKGEILEINNGSKYLSLSDLNAAKKMNKAFSSARWIQEDIVYNNGKPANDIKVYCFYGEIGLILEVDRASGPKPLYCYYNSDGQRVDVGRKRVPNFVGNGVPEIALKYAKKISLASPVPFLRIDFFKGDKASVLGEITPHPGWHAGERTDYWDFELGKLFDQAWARLYIDMVNGKKFADFFSVYCDIK